MIYLVQRNQIRKRTKQEYTILKDLTHTAKNLYNETLYNIKIWFTVYDEYLRYEDAYYILKNSTNYKHLPSQVAQQVMKMVDRTWHSFFGLKNARTSGSYTMIVREPHFLPKDSY